MNARETVRRLAKALVLWAVLAVMTGAALKALSVFAGLLCGVEWIALATLFVLHLLGPVMGATILKNVRTEDEA